MAREVGAEMAVGERHRIGGVELRLGHPDELSMDWVGNSDLQLQLMAAWTVLDPGDLPLNPRLIGKPGVGKTTLAYATARAMRREVYLFQATMDTRPEDLLVTPVVGEGKSIEYVASPLVTAMIRGGVAILDEGNRMSEKSWASLAPLLDSRRYVESVVAGIKIPAHEDFRFCATMNDDSSTFELPEYIFSRLQPQITVDYPDSEDEMLILKRNLPHVSQEVLSYVQRFLSRARGDGEDYTVRDGINVGRYAARPVQLQEKTVRSAVSQAVEMILGDEAQSYV